MRQARSTPSRQRFRLPALTGNFAEGLVIKPDVEARPADRVVFKRKLAEFDETRLEESAPVEKDTAMGLGALTAFGRQLVNGPRFDSARSKLGEGPPQALIDEVILDVLVDLEAAFPARARTRRGRTSAKWPHGTGSETTARSRPANDPVQSSKSADEEAKLETPGMSGNEVAMKSPAPVVWCPGGDQDLATGKPP